MSTVLNDFKVIKIASNYWKFVQGMVPVAKGHNWSLKFDVFRRSFDHFERNSGIWNLISESSSRDRVLINHD